MAGEARESRIFRNSRIEVIPYGIDLQTFAPLPKGRARESFGIPEDAFVLLFACSSAAESRKGADFLKEIVKALAKEPELEALRQSRKLWLLLVGWGTADPF